MSPLEPTPIPPPKPWWQTPQALWGLAAAGVLVVVIAVVAVSQSGGDDADENVATDATESATATEPITVGSPTPESPTDDAPTPTPALAETPTPIPTPTASPTGPTGPPAGAIWPLESYRPFGQWPSTPEDAAQLFVSSLGGWTLPIGEVTFLDPVDMVARVSLQTVGEDGEPFGEAVSVEAVGGFDSDGNANWGVKRATSDMIQIDRTFWESNRLIPEGRGWAFEGVIEASLVDPTSKVAGSGFVMGGGVELAPLTGSVAATESLPGPGYALFYDLGGLGIAPSSLTVVPVQLPTVDESSECSALGLDQLDPDPSLPNAVDATRLAIAAAAIECDYATLDSLTGDDFFYSFGSGPGDAGQFWADAEAAGDEPLRFMVELLGLPAAVDATGSPVFYVWPEAFAIPWNDLTDSQKNDLRALYDQEAMDLFEEFGSYIGYRHAIDETGEWVFFIAGD